MGLVKMFKEYFGARNVEIELQKREIEDIRRRIEAQYHKDNLQKLKAAPIEGE